MSFPADNPGAGPLRILVVENHPDTLKYLCLYLEQLGHTVRGATSVGDALREIENDSWEVVISDIGLPDAPGWDLLEKAHLPPNVYAIAMSGFGLSHDQRRSKAAGFRHHLLKPFTPDALDDYLAEAAREKAALQEPLSASSSPSDREGSNDSA